MYTVHSTENIRKRNGNTRKSFENNFVNDSLCEFTLWSSKLLSNGITFTHDTWIPTEGKELKVFRESGNPKEKFAGCVKVNKNFFGHLKKSAMGRFAKAISFFLLCKLLEKSVILEMERARKSLAD